MNYLDKENQIDLIDQLPNDSMANAPKSNKPLKLKAVCTLPLPGDILKQKP